MTLDHKAALETASSNPCGNYGADNLAACYIDLHTRHERLRELAKEIKADLVLRAEMSMEDGGALIDLSSGLWMRLCAELEKEQ